MSERDQRIAEFFGNGTRVYLVKNLEIGHAGAFALILENDFAMDVFPDDSSASEHWRLFKPYQDEVHFVVSGTGTGEEVET